MKNRGLFARQLARVKEIKEAKKSKTAKKAKKEVVDPPKVIQQILGSDPETGEVVAVFNDFDEAVAHGLLKANIKSSIKTGKKYKGRLWQLSK